MLLELRVEQFAIIEQLSVHFDEGLNVLTGETGAGKSLLVDALGLALGGRGSAELIRDGHDEAVVEALFRPSDPLAREALDRRIEGLGLPVDEGGLLVRRVLSRRGRHRVYLNGALATTGLLARAVGGLGEICGQHEHVTLVEAGTQLQLLDAYARADSPRFAGLLEAWRGAWAELSAARAALEALDGDEASRAQREDFLRFQLEEIERVAPVSGEDAELEDERLRLRNVHRLRQASALAEGALYADDGAVAEVLARVCDALEEVARLDPTLAAAHGALTEARVTVEEVGRDLAGYGARLEDTPDRLDEVEGRLAELWRLARKYGGDLSGALEAADALRGELEGLTGFEERLEAARAALSAAEARAQQAAQALSAARKRAATRLSRAAQEGLDALGMGGSRFSISLAARPLGPEGGDRVEFQVAQGDAQPRALAKVASGGELSRLLLALRSALSATDTVPSVVFDEVDTGIGGATAEVVGRLLRGVASDRQVLCITHLPQVAAYGARHLVVQKEVRGRRVETKVLALRPEGRVEELARMLGGVELTETTRAHASELLARAQQLSSPDHSGVGRADQDAA